MPTAERARSPYVPIPTDAPAVPGTIGVVTAELLRYAAFWRSVMSLRRPPGTAVAQKAGLGVAANRNSLVEAMEGDWLFCLDDDLVLPPDTLMRLLAVMEAGGWDIVSAFTLRRNPPFDALVYVTDPLEPGGCPPWVPDGRTGVMDVAAGGLGAVLIHRRVFDRLEAPYFRNGQVNPSEIQEDVEFFHRARVAGLSACVDLDTPVGHVTPMAVWPARDPGGAHCAALAGVGGEIVPVNTAALRASLQVHPPLIGG